MYLTLVLGEYIFGVVKLSRESNISPVKFFSALFVLLKTCNYCDTFICFSAAVVQSKAGIALAAFVCDADSRNEVKALSLMFERFPSFRLRLHERGFISIRFYDFQNRTESDAVWKCLHGTVFVQFTSCRSHHRPKGSE